jgi:hypothetical protein
MMMRHELLDEALTTIRAAGFVPSVARNKHFKVSWTDQQGRTRLLVIAFSPSDYRPRAKSGAVLRRLLVRRQK